MRTWHTTLAAGVLATLAMGPADAQQVTLATPFHTLSDHFFENSGISWSGNYRGIGFSFGGGALAAPPFGGFDPNAGLRTNFGIYGKDLQINFNLSYGQGYRQSAITQTPSVTVMNGQTGIISDTSQTPFVIGVIPVVGGFPVVPPQWPQVPGFVPSTIGPRIQAMLDAHAEQQAQAAVQADAQARLGGPSGLCVVGWGGRTAKPPKAPDPGPGRGEAVQERLNAAQRSTAGRPALSVAEAKRLHQEEMAAANGEMAALMERARALEEDGKPGAAKIYYQQIANHATGELQQQAKTRLYELQGDVKP